MAEREYQKYVFERIYSKLADGPGGNSFADFFDIRDEGVWPGKWAEGSLDWTPAQDCYQPGRPSPLTSPSLPFPFTARQLAAFMLDDIGYFVRERFGEWNDGPDAGHFREREAEALEVLEAAYAAYREATWFR